MKNLIALAAVLVTPTLLVAQSPVVGINLRGTQHVWTSNTSDFINQWVAGPSTSGQVVFALDFDASATTLYGINFHTSEFGSIDLATGAFTTLGATNLPLSTARGLTAHPDGHTWYVLGGAGTDNEVYAGNLTTGLFTSLGTTAGTQLLIDIACDSHGKLFAHSIVDDSLYIIDTADSSETLVGPLGVDINFAQGMDFDWSDDTLYAALYVGNGVSQFASIDTLTGAVIHSEDTTALDAELEMAIQVPAPPDPGVGAPFCDPMDPNSTGQSTTLSGSMTAPTGSGLHLEASQGPPGEFGYFLIGTAPSDPGISISRGRLCLSVAAPNGFGRYNVVGGPLNSVGSFDAAGVMQNLPGTSSVGSGFDVPNTIPMTGSPVITGGQTFYFQMWHRDTPEGPGLSNFSNGLGVTF